MKKLFALGAVILWTTAAQAAERIVSLGASVTEVVYALGQEATLAGVDSSSHFPEAVTHLPQVGYVRMLGAEGVLSLKPTLILASEDAGPPEVVEQLKQAGVRFVPVPSVHSLQGACDKIRAIAAALACEGKGEQLIHALLDAAAQDEMIASPVAQRPRVLFIYTRGPGALNIAGTDTAADAMIKLGGGVNAVTEYHGYKPLTPEAAVAAKPDVILTTSQGLEGLGGVDGLLKQGGLELTPAGENRRVIALDDLYLLGFGPRTGEAVAELRKRLLEPAKAL